MGDQFGNSDDDMERGDWPHDRLREDELLRKKAEHDQPFVVFVPQLGGGAARPYFFTMDAAAKAFTRETGGTLFARANIFDTGGDNG